MRKGEHAVLSDPHRTPLVSLPDLLQSLLWELMSLSNEQALPPSDTALLLRINTEISDKFLNY